MYLKSVSKWSTAVSLKKQPKYVSDTGNPYHVACLELYRLLWKTLPTLPGSALSALYTQHLRCTKLSQNHAKTNPNLFCLISCTHTLMFIYFGCIFI